jgi:hypothetical protein
MWHIVACQNVAELIDFQMSALMQLHRVLGGQKKCGWLSRIREGYKTLNSRGGSLHLKSCIYISKNT